MRTKLRHKLILTAAACLLALWTARSQAANFLEEVAISRSGDSIFVTVTTSHECEYKTFLTEGKPERIVIDLEGVTNDWRQTRYYDLPLKSIQAVRTSQYQVSPYLVSRVVLDIGRPTDFRSSRDGNTITVRFPVASEENQSVSWTARGQKVPSPTAPKQTAAAKPAPAKKAPRTKPSGVRLESYPKRKIVRYRASSTRDPFVPLVGIRGTLVEGLPTLENLKLVGVLEDIDGNKALLEDAEGNGYILEANDRIRNGYVVSVEEDRAIFQVTEYGWTRTVALELELPQIK